jgi:hypothetical protein
MEVRYVPWGLANNFGDYIELNEHLPEYPELHDAILKHEVSHTNKEFSKDDFILDISPSKVSSWKLLKFMVWHPKTFLQLAPFYIYQKKFVYDVNLCIAWGVFIGIAGLAAFLALH